MESGEWRVGEVVLVCGCFQFFFSCLVVVLLMVIVRLIKKNALLYEDKMALLSLGLKLNFVPFRTCRYQSAFPQFPVSVG